MNRLALLVAGAFFMEFLDGTIITTALPRMAQSLGAAPVDLHIGISAYLLTVAVFILPGGWAASRFGGRPVFTGAIIVFTLGSALCGMAQSVEGFVAARVLQGIGGAMMVPVGRLVVLRTTEKQDLMRAVALLTWPGLTAPLLGPPLGGWMAEHLSWRWIFLINVPLGVIATVLALVLVPRLDRHTRLPFDRLGFVLGAALLLGLTEALDLVGAAVVPWTEVGMLTVIAIVSCVILVRHVHRVKHPLLDPALFRFGTFRMVMVGGTGMRVLIGTMPFLLPLLFQLGFGWDAVSSGLTLLALFAGNIGMKTLTTGTLRRFGFRHVMVVNGLLQAATMFACGLLTATTPLWVVVPLMVLSGASRSLQFTALGTLAFADVPQPSMSGANTLFSVAFQLSLGLGVALAAVTLGVGSHLIGDDGVPTLAAFHLTFAVFGGLMTLNALDALRLPRDAGAIVSGHRIRGASAAGG